MTCSALGQLVEGAKEKRLRDSVLKKQFVKKVTSVRPRPKSMVLPISNLDLSPSIRPKNYSLTPPAERRGPPQYSFTGITTLNNSMFSVQRIVETVARIITDQLQV